MKFNALLSPAIIQDIIKNLPQVIFDLISWKEFMQQSALLSKRLLIDHESDTLREIKQKLKVILPNDIYMASEFDVQIGLTEKLGIKEGEKILHLYFLQIMNCEKYFLDFRSNLFCLKKLDDNLGANDNKFKFVFRPNHLWGEFDPHFGQGIRQVYQGYFDKNEKLFTEGLLLCRLIGEDFSEEQINDVRDVFIKHFSSGITEKVSFDLEKFKESFSAIFQVLLKHKIKIDKNFLYLGISLVTLYMTLSQIGGSYDVAKIFKQVNRNK